MTAIRLACLLLGLASSPSASTIQASSIAPPPPLETGVLPASWAVLNSDCVSGRAFRAHE